MPPPPPSGRRLRLPACPPAPSAAAPPLGTPTPPWPPWPPWPPPTCGLCCPLPPALPPPPAFGPSAIPGEPTCLLFCLPACLPAYLPDCLTDWEHFALKTPSRTQLTASALTHTHAPTLFAPLQQLFRPLQTRLVLGARRTRRGAQRPAARHSLPAPRPARQRLCCHARRLPLHPPLGLCKPGLPGSAVNGRAPARCTLHAAPSAAPPGSRRAVPAPSPCLWRAHSCRHGRPLLPLPSPPSCKPAKG